MVFKGVLTPEVVFFLNFLQINIKIYRLTGNLLIFLFWRLSSCIIRTHKTLMIMMIYSYEYLASQRALEEKKLIPLSVIAVFAYAQRNPSLGGETLPFSPPNTLIFIIEPFQTLKQNFIFFPH